MHHSIYWQKFNEKNKIFILASSKWKKKAKRLFTTLITFFFPVFFFIFLFSLFHHLYSLMTKRKRVTGPKSSNNSEIKIKLRTNVIFIAFSTSIDQSHSLTFVHILIIMIAVCENVSILNKIAGKKRKQNKH